MSRSMTTVKSADVNDKKREDEINVQDIIKENADLKKQIQDFSEQLESIKSMLKTQNKESINKIDNNKEEEFEPIRPDKYIKVMSLTPELLNLNAGNGKIISINKYGEIKNIMYGDLVNIINNHYELASDGGFYIFDDEAVRISGLQEYYKKILDKNGLEELLKKSQSEIKEVLDFMSDVQKKALVNNIIINIYNGKDISTSIIDIIDKSCEVNIMEKVQEMKNFDEEVSNLEKNT